MAEKVNLRPDKFTETSGLIDDFDGVISDIRFVMTDYNGRIDSTVPCACIIYDVNGESFDDLLSVGGSDDFVPDETGMGLVPLKHKSTLSRPKKGMGEPSKFVQFLDSLIVAGFPLNKMDDEDISYLNGTSGHFVRKTVEWKGVKKKEGERESTVLLCTKIIQLPWDAKDTKGKRKSGAKSKAADPELAETVAGIIQGVLIEKDGEVARKDMLSILFKHPDVNEPNDKKAILKLASNDAYLKDREEWSFEDGVLKMA